jgi:hypothetical protein
MYFCQIEAVLPVSPVVYGALPREQSNNDDARWVSLRSTHPTRASKFISDSVGDLGSANMQPLSRVRPNAQVVWGSAELMSSRPKMAIKIAECIAEWADIETMLGLILSLLLNADAKAALAMYAAVENRSAQRRMILAAAKTKLPPEHYKVLSAFMSAAITPAAKRRDKLAHWSWALSPEIPDCLLLSKPEHKMQLHFNAVHLPGERMDVLIDPSQIFVVTEADLSEAATFLTQAKDYASLFMASIWTRNSPQARAGSLDQLSKEPCIREALERLAVRQNNPTAQPLQPQPTPHEES